MELPEPTHRERVALFRLSVVGDLLARDLASGELKMELRRRSDEWYRPPDADCTRTFSYKTLQRWYYAAKKDLAAGLLPESRVRGFARKLNEHPSASADLVLSEAVRNGVVAAGDLTVSTLRRLYRSAEMPRVSRRRADRGDVQRRRWQAEHPGDLWHGDVCHLALVDEKGRPRKVLVHGFLDDTSRYVIALVARLREREQDMLEVLCGALLRHPPPRMIFLDNGACYRGEVLRLVCQRLGIRLVHAQPYSPEARGKMERFWRTMRQRCTDHLASGASVHEVGQALAAFLDADYHRRPHAGLLGETPRRRYLDGLPRQAAPLTPKQLAKALEVSLTRQVRNDGTFEMAGRTYEVSGRHLAGKRITLVIDALTDRILQTTWQDQPVRFGPCDPVANRHRRRPPAGGKTDHNGSGTAGVPFDPIAALLAKAREVDDE